MYFVCPSDAESNSWERENIISQDANDRLVTGARLVKIHPDRHLERRQSRSKKKAKHRRGQARNDGQTIPTTVCVRVKTRKKARPSLKLTQQREIFFLVLTVNVPCDDVLLFYDSEMSLSQILCCVSRTLETKCIFRRRIHTYPSCLGVEAGLQPGQVGSLL